MILTVVHWKDKIHMTTIALLFLINARFSLLYRIRGFDFISKSKEIYESNSDFKIYHLVIWSYIDFLLYFQWMTFPILSCLVL